MIESFAVEDENDHESDCGHVVVVLEEEGGSDHQDLPKLMLMGCQLHQMDYHFQMRLELEEQSFVHS